jgi:putative ABC transport system substrate-binding protein
VNRAIAALTIWLVSAATGTAQESSTLPLVGVLRIDTPATIGFMARMFREALAERGNVEGKNIRLDFRLANGDATRFPEMAAALVRDRPSVIVASGEAAAQAARVASRTIPIVAATNDLLASGLVASLARPGGNVTGVSLLITELDAKRLEVLKQLVPSGRRFGVLNDPAVSTPTGLEAISQTARALGVEIVTVEVRNPNEIPAAIQSFSEAKVDGVNVLSSPLFNGLREQLGPLLLKHKLPAICEWREMASAGCTASYGTTLRELYGALAGLTDKMLKGASPAETPAQQPTRSELVINRRAVQAIGIDIPPTLLARADEVIE